MLSKSSAILLTALILISTILSTNSLYVNTNVAAALSEPLVAVSDNAGITRSSTYPVSKFFGRSVMNLTETITWNINGTVSVADSRGNSFGLSMPITSNKGTTIALLQNSTMIDQRVVGNGLAYDAYWKPLRSSDGMVDRYKLSIVGTAINSTRLSFRINTNNQATLAKDDVFIATNLNMGNIIFNSTSTSSNLANAISGSTTSTSSASNSVGSNKTSYAPPTYPLGSLPEGIGIDWSDATKLGYLVQFDSSTSSFNVSVGTSFSIDPTIIDTVTAPISPPTSDYYEGERRVVQVGSTLFALYYDGSNIKVASSTDNGVSWSNFGSAQTGQLASDNFRWTTAHTAISGTDYITVFYTTVSGGTTSFYAKRGTVSGNAINWAASPSLLFSAPSFDSTGGYASASATTDTTGNIFVVFRYLQSGGTTYQYQVRVSTDGGLNWPTSNSGTLLQTDGGTGTRIEVTLSRLASGKMLLAYTYYSVTTITYRVYDPGTNAWSNAQTVSPTGMTANSIKQISSDSDSSNSAWIVYLTSGNSGTPYVQPFNSSGSPTTAERADSSSASYSLPSITIASDGIIRVYALSNNKVAELQRSVSWSPATNPFGLAFNSPNELTSAIGYAGAIWEENSVSPFSVEFAADGSAATSPNLTLDSISVALSPQSTDYYEGERRVVQVNGNLFAFYSDSADIAYKFSTDGGKTWGTKTLSNSGALDASENFRWTVVKTNVGGNDYITLLYFKQSGTNTNFYANRGQITSGTSISWSGSQFLFSEPNFASCMGGVCAATVASADTGGKIFAAFRYIPSGSSTYKYQIRVSTDGGLSWPTTNAGTLSELDSGSGSRIEMALTKAASGKMLFAFAKYESSEFAYILFDGASWGLGQSTSGAGMTINTIKQISSDSDTSNAPYVAYITSGPPGNLMVARWSTAGTFLSFEPVNSNLSHSLPSITVTSSNVVSIYTLVTGKVYETRRIGSWLTPTNAFGNTFTSANEVSAGIATASAVWEENSAAPFNVRFGTVEEKWSSGGTGYLISNNDSTLAGQAEDSSVFYLPSQNTLVDNLFTQIGPNLCEIHRSTDNGVTWSTNVFTIPKSPGANRESDPVVTSDRGGNMYAACLSLFTSDGFNYNPGDIVIYQSADGGQTWTLLNTISHSATNHLNDKDWIAADHSSNSTTQGHLYSCWSDISHSSNTSTINFKRIIPLDSSPKTLVTGDLGNSEVSGCNIAIGPNGQIYLFWQHFSSASSGTIEMARNYNGGDPNSWTSVVSVSIFYRGITCTFGFNECVTGYSSSMIRLNHFPSAEVDSGGTIHMVFTNYDSTSKSDIKYTESSNCQTSGSACTFNINPKINLDAVAPNPNADQFNSVLAVSSKTTPATIHVTAFDRRDDINNINWIPYDYYCHLYTDCTNSANWYNTKIITTSSANYDMSSFVGDYEGITYSNSVEDYATWTDDRNSGQSQNYDVYGDKKP